MVAEGSAFAKQLLSVIQELEMCLIADIVIVDGDKSPYAQHDRIHEMQKNTPSE